MANMRHLASLRSFQGCFCRTGRAPIRKLAVKQAPVPVQRYRNYHSYEHDIPPPFPPTEEKILSAALPHVPAHGFTTAALSLGARDAGYLDISTNLFPTGAFALVYYHLVTQRRALSKTFLRITTPPPDVSANVKDVALQRLHANRPIIHRWQEALALSAMPSNAVQTFRELALLSDEILFLAGSTAVDASWYTKRLALSGIYASAELFMTTDTSPGFKETEGFLERRLEGAEAASSTVDNIGEWVSMQGWGLLNGLRSKGVRI